MPRGRSLGESAPGNGGGAHGTSERSLKNRQVLADPTFQRERLVTLDPRAFERVSGARTGELIGLLHDWDHELGMQ